MRTGTALLQYSEGRRDLNETLLHRPTLMHGATSSPAVDYSDFDSHIPRELNLLVRPYGPLRQCYAVPGFTTPLY